MKDEGKQTPMRCYVCHQDYLYPRWTRCETCAIAGRLAPTPTPVPAPKGDLREAIERYLRDFVSLLVDKRTRGNAERDTASRILALIPAPKGIKEPSEQTFRLDFGCPGFRPEPKWGRDDVCKCGWLKSLHKSQIGDASEPSNLSPALLPYFDGRKMVDIVPSNPIPSPTNGEPPKAREWTITRLSRFNNDHKVEGPEIKPGWTIMVTEGVREVLKGEAPPPSIREALEGLLESYLKLTSHWEPEGDQAVIQARAALAVSRSPARPPSNEVLRESVKAAFLEGCKTFWDRREMGPDESDWDLSQAKKALESLGGRE